MRCVRFVDHHNFGFFSPVHFHFFPGTMSLLFSQNGKHGKSAVNGVDGTAGLDFGHGVQRDGAAGTNAGKSQLGILCTANSPASVNC